MNRKHEQSSSVLQRICDVSGWTGHCAKWYRPLMLSRAKSMQTVHRTCGVDDVSLVEFVGDLRSVQSKELIQTMRPDGLWNCFKV